MSRITACCSDGLHDQCSTRVVTNPSAGWHKASYAPCECNCHSVVAGIERARQAQQEHEQKHDVQLEIPMSQREHTQDCLDDQFMHHAATGGDIENCYCPPKIHGPGPDCQPED